jgi:zinc transport system substrate-binding protein
MGTGSLVVTALAVCGVGSNPGGAVTIAASVLPLADIAQRIAGPGAEVVCLLPPGASPHSYEFTPSLVRQIARARVFVRVGLGFEPWADRALEAAGPGQRMVIEAADGVALEPMPGADHHEAYDPHVWLDPQVGRSVGFRIAEALADLDTGRAVAYRARAKAFDKELAVFEEELKETCARFEQREFVALHPAWQYFGRRCGIRQVTALEVAPGRESFPRRLVQACEWIRAHGAKAVFAEAQGSPSVARTLAEETGAQLFILDPLGGAPGRRSYLEMLRYNLSVFARALGRVEAGSP